MTTGGGGWTRISYEDFSTVPVGWSDTRRDTTDCGAANVYTAMLGGVNAFGSGAIVNKTYNLLNIAHTEAKVGLDYVVIDSWDGESAIVRLAGVTIFNQPYNHQNIPAVNRCGGGWQDYGPQAVTGTVAHTTNTVLLEVTSTLDQGPTDESFGVDNVYVWVR
jgi:hypothetical protein